MSSGQTLLVMAGSREAHSLVTALVARGRRVIASLPEPERMFGDLPVPTRIGGFACQSQLSDWMTGQEIAAVIDASHPFDTAISRMTAEVCRGLAVRYLRVLRPPWVESPLDCWRHFGSIGQAARAVPATACVFTNTGWSTLPEYADFAGRRLYIRQNHAVEQPAPFPFAEFVEGRPPFSQFQEEALFERLGVTHLICRNVGGAASMSKLLAARALSLPVFMVDRTPPLLSLPVAETVVEALAWEAGQ